MNTRFHDKIRRLGVLLAIATAFTALVAAPALGQDRPASSYYKPQDLQRMSDSWPLGEASSPMCPRRATTCHSRLRR
jgi:hypothetical protein